LSQGCPDLVRAVLFVHDPAGLLRPDLVVLEKVEDLAAPLLAGLLLEDLAEFPHDPTGFTFLLLLGHTNSTTIISQRVVIKYGALNDGRRRRAEMFDPIYIYILSRILGLGNLKHIKL
jgi:hypothetical protein